MIPVEQIEKLPLYNRVTIPTDYLDLMGHLNIRWYVAIYDDAAWGLFADIGMNENYYHECKAGGFALQQFIRYLAEVRVGETVAIRARVLGRSEKRVHFMLFMVNETTQKLASTFEVLGSHADMSVRRTSPYPPNIAAKIDALLTEHNTLDWDAPVCGIIKP